VRVALLIGLACSLLLVAAPTTSTSSPPTSSTTQAPQIQQGARSGYEEPRQGDSGADARPFAGDHDRDASDSEKDREPAYYARENLKAQRRIADATEWMLFWSVLAAVFGFTVSISSVVIAMAAYRATRNAERRDVFGRRRETSFCWLFQRPSLYFTEEGTGWNDSEWLILDGPPEYFRQT
jgi:hypothetical protein